MGCSLLTLKKESFVSLWDINICFFTWFCSPHPQWLRAFKNWYLTLSFVEVLTCSTHIPPTSLKEANVRILVGHIYLSSFAFVARNHSGCRLPKIEQIMSRETSGQVFPSVMGAASSGSPATQKSSNIS